MPVSKEQAMTMFDYDLGVVMDDVRGLLRHYQIADWEAYLFFRKPDCPQSYVLKYEATAGDEFAQKIVALHAASSPARELSGSGFVRRLSLQEGNNMTGNYDAFRAGMLRAAEMCRNEFKRAPEAAKGHDSVYMGGYEDACDHLSAAIAQAAVIDSVRIAGAQPDWQYHIALLLPDGAVSDEALLKIYQVVEHELRTAATPAAPSPGERSREQLRCPNCGSVAEAHRKGCSDVVTTTFPGEIETRAGLLPLSLLDEIQERRETLYKGFGYEHYAPQMKTDLDHALAIAAALRTSVESEKS